MEADVIAGPSWPLEGRAFSPASSAACAGAQLVTWSVRPPE